MASKELRAIMVPEMKPLVPQPSVIGREAQARALNSDVSPAWFDSHKKLAPRQTLGGCLERWSILVDHHRFKFP